MHQSGLLVVLCCAVLQLGCSSAPSIEAVEAVRAADQARFAAVVQQDFEALETLLAEDLVYCHSSGVCEGKRSYIDSLKRGALRYQSFASTSAEVQLFDEVAVVNGRVTLVVAVGEDPPNEVTLGYTDVFVEREGRWQMVAWRSVAVQP